MGLIVGQSRSKRHGFAFRRPGMALRNGTRRDLWPELRHMLSEIDELPNVGRENRPLARSREIAQEIVGLKLAERVGVIARDFRKPNVYSGFWLISRNGNDLASSNLRLHFRPFTGACRFFYFDDTRNGIHGLLPLSKSTWAIAERVVSAVIHPASDERRVRVRAIMENPHTGGQSLKSGLEGLVISRPRPVPV